jgi:hypothetical protein
MITPLLLIALFTGGGLILIVSKAATEMSQGNVCQGNGEDRWLNPYSADSRFCLQSALKLNPAFLS